jgi:hypothetical protein
MRPEEVLTLVLVIALAVAGLILVAWLPWGHFTRVLAAAVPLAIGLGVAVSARRKFRWWVRMAWLGGGLVAAALAWVFVPTTGGLNLWMAYQEADRLANQLENLKAGSQEGFAIIQADREKLLVQFPSFGPALQAPELDWVKRSVAQWENDLKQLPAQDLEQFQVIWAASREMRRNRVWAFELGERLDQAALDWMERRVDQGESDLKKLPVRQFEQFEKTREANRWVPPLRRDTTPLKERLARAEQRWLARTFDSLKPGDFATARKTRAFAGSRQEGSQEVQTAEDSWVKRTAEAVIKQAVGPLANQPVKASALLRKAAQDIGAYGAFPSTQDRLLAQRRLALANRLKAAQHEFREWIQADRDEQVGDIARRLLQDSSPEAEAVGVMKSLTDFSSRCQVWAELARKKKYWEWSERLTFLSGWPRPGLPVNLSLRAVWIQRGPQALAAKK